MKHKFIGICIWLLFSNIPNIFASSTDLNDAVHKICQQLTKGINPRGESIAIPPFLTLNNRTTVLGKLLSEKLMGQFSNQNIFIPVEREFIFKLTDEMKLGMTGLVEPKTVQQVGKFSGAAYVLVGTIQKVGGEVQIISRLVRTETSRVEKSIETVIRSSPETLELISQEIQLPLLPTPEETGQPNMMHSDFGEIRKEYAKMQNERDKFKLQMAQAKNEVEKNRIMANETKVLNLLSAGEYFIKGNIANSIGNFKLAVDHFSKAIEINPKDADSYLNRGLMYLKMKNAILAISDFDRCVGLNPSIGEAYGGRGMAYGMMGDTDRAIADFNKGIEVTPKHAGLYYNRGVIWGTIGKPLRAIDDYTSAIEINPMYSKAFFNRALNYAEMGDTTRAISDYSQVLKINSELVEESYVNRGNCYSSIGENDSALSDYNRVIELDPKSAMAYFNRAIIYARRNQYSALKRDLKKACELGADEACNMLDCKVASKIDPLVATNIDPASKFIRLKYHVKYIEGGGSKPMQLMGQKR